MNPGKMLSAIKDKLVEINQKREIQHASSGKEETEAPAQSQEVTNVKEEAPTQQDGFEPASEELNPPTSPDYPDSAEELEESTLVEPRSDDLPPVPEESAFQAVEKLQDIQAQHAPPKELLDPNAPELNEPITSSEADQETDAIFSDLIEKEGGADTHIADADEMVDALNRYNEKVKNTTFSLEDTDGLNDDGSLVK